MRALKVISVLLGLAILVVGGTAFMAWNAFNPSPPAAQAFVNGNIITLDDNNSIAEAVLVRDGQIAAIGTSDEIRAQAGSSADFVDLNGQTMMPGIIDAHGHFPADGIYAVAVDANSPPIGTKKTIAEIVADLKEKAKTTPKGKWLLAWGYDDTMLEDQRHLNRHDLDAASTDHPIVAMHLSGHMGVLNSKGLEVVGIDEFTPDPSGGEIIRDELTGQPTGLLMETAINIPRDAAMAFDLEQLLALLQEGSNRYLENGVTTAQNGLTEPSQFTPAILAAKFGVVPMRLVLFPEANYALELAELDKLFQHHSRKTIIGAAKIVGDGSIQGYTGYLSQPYHVIPEGMKKTYRGYPIHKQDALDVLVERLYAFGVTPAIHGNGDEAIEMILQAVKKAREAQPQSKNLRPILIHAQMMRRDQVARAKELNISPSFFSSHVYYWGDRHRDLFMGPERAKNMSPMKWAQEQGVRFTTHLDAPVVPMTPFLMIWSSVTRRTANGDVLGAEQGIEVIDALRATTIDAAWQVGIDDWTGSIETGKQADLIVLDKDPLSIPVEELKDIQVQRTIVGGVSFYTRP